MKKFALLVLGLLCLLGCENKAPDAPPEKVEPKKLPELFTALFEDTTVVNMHFYSTLDKNLTDYPYVGKKIEPEFRQFLNEGLLANADWGLFAINKLPDGSYILRVPSREFSNELVLCSPDKATGKLKKVAVLANAWCRTERCHQQDAWLTDLDGDQSLELITRKRDTNPEGKIVGKQFKVTTRNQRDGFELGKEEFADPLKYVMSDKVIPKG